MTKQATIARPGRFAPPDAQSVLDDTLNELEQENSKTPRTVKKEIVSDSDPKKEDEPTSEPEVELTPIEKWRKRLEAAGITEEQADAITDAILRQGYWEKEFTLLPSGKIKMTLRTREPSYRQRLAHALSNLPVGMHYETQMRFELAASMAKFNDTPFSVPSPKAKAEDQDKSFTERLQFVDEKIPDPLLDVIRGALIQFNKTVYAALNEGAVEGF